MSSSTTPQSILGILVVQGKEIPNLLRQAKERDVDGSGEILGKMENIVTCVLSNIKNAPESAFFVKESLEKLVKKLVATLEEFIKHDPEYKSGYEELIKEVGDFQYQKEISAISSNSSKLDSYSDSSTSEEPDIDASVLEKLTPDEKQCLYCFLLFPENTEIKKREIVHCWIGMGSVDMFAAERLLAKFMAIGLIERTVLNKKLLGKYKVSGNVRSLLLDQATPSIPKIDGKSWSTLRPQRQDKGNAADNKEKRALWKSVTMISPQDPSEKEDYEALLNINQTTLNASRFKTMSGMDSLKVVHLGCWQQDSKKYIVVDDIDSFRYLKNLSMVRFLSLEGVSGMVMLPKSVCALEFLRVLDLRACNNLELLPARIDLLKNLTHLDLSGCYLLDHVPLTITSLTNLQVLKGFIVDHTQNQKAERRKGKGKGNGKGTTSSSPCPFEKLSILQQLRKLTIITRRVDFPTPQDLKTLGDLVNLTCLRISWNYSPVIDITTDDYAPETFPKKLKKLELQAASDLVASRVLGLFSTATSNCSLEKLYIRGGGLLELKHIFLKPTVVRLRYLPELQMDWVDFTRLFPNMGRLEILECPNLILFPCDKNGIWEHTPTPFKTRTSTW